MPILVRITLVSRFLVCRVSPDLKFKIGFLKMLAGTGVEFWKGKKRKD
jgi:hypothetical protein